VMNEGIEFQTDRNEHQKANFASSVLVNGTVSSGDSTHQALKLQDDLSLNKFPCSVNWKRHPGRPHGRWVDQLR